MPVTATSILVAPETGYFYAVKGFSLRAPTSWTLEQSGDEKDPSDGKDEFSVLYANPEFPSARLTVKTNTLATAMTLENYAKKWMRDYSGYGFDVLGAKTFSANKAKGLVVDLIHRTRQNQLRQVIFVKNKTAVTLTCIDQTKTFDKSLSGCNQIFKTFVWQ